jgi:hypothetical protein
MLPATIRSRVMGRSSLGPLKDPAFRIIDALQSVTDPSVQLDALALTFALVARGTGIDPHELVSRAHRQLRDADALRNPTIEAIEAYAQGELR